MSVLGALLCFSNHFKGMPVLQPDTMDMVKLASKDMRVRSSFLD